MTSQWCRQAGMHAARQRGDQGERYESLSAVLESMYEAPVS
jgi:hypothetical protein